MPPITSSEPKLFVTASTAMRSARAWRSTGSAAPAMLSSGPTRDKSICITPPHGFDLFQQPHQTVEQQPDDSDDDHASDHQVIAIAGVARVHDQVAEPRAQRDHLGGDHDEPGDAEPDAHADDDLGQHGGDDDLPEQL